MKAFKLLIVVCGMFFWSTAFSYSQKELKPDLNKLVDGQGWKVFNRSVSRLTDGGYQGVRFDARPDIGVAWLENYQFSNGVIEFDVRGKDLLQRSFVGLAFHGVDEQTYDAIYFRPFNFKSSDALRRLHQVQYISHPEFTWQKLRSEHPEQYEKAVQPVPDPNGWFHVRVVIEHPTVSVLVNDAREPSLVVKQLSNRKTGWLGFYISNESEGDFANLKITPAR